MIDPSTKISGGSSVGARTGGTRGAGRRPGREARRPTRAVAYIVLSGILGVAGQLLMKQGATALPSVSIDISSLLAVALVMLLNPLVIFGLAVYGTGTFFWLIALSRVDLSYAYPFASLNYVLVFFASWLLLGEQPTLGRAIGVLAICLGVWAISGTAAKTSSSLDMAPSAPGRATEGRTGL